MSSPDATAEILARLDALALQVATLTAAVSAAPLKVRTRPASAPSKYLTPLEACAVLRCSRTTLDGHAARGLCTQHRPKGRGRGKPVRYEREEIETLARSEDAARELMARKRKARPGTSR